MIGEGYCVRDLETKVPITKSTNMEMPFLANSLQLWR